MKPTPSRALVALASALLVPACASAPPAAPPPPEPVQWTRVLEGAEISIPRSAELDEVAVLEDRRDLGDGRLIQLLEQGEPLTRARAAVALGRFPYPEFGRDVTRALCGRLDDPACRLEAAFALGQRADPSSAGVLAAYRNDSDPKMRARIVEAASRIDEPGLRRECLFALRDSDLSVRIEAAVGAARWSRDSPDAADVDRALLDTLRPYTIAPDPTGRQGRTARTAVEAELVWRILYSLSRRRSELGRGAFLEYASSDVTNERLFAVRGLAHLAPDAEVVDKAIGALDDPDWRVAYEATAVLRVLRDGAAVGPLTEAANHPSAHVRAGAMAAMAALDVPVERRMPPLRQGLVDLSPTVRNAALEAIARVAPPTDTFEILDRLPPTEGALLRAGAVAALAAIETDDATLASEIVRRLYAATGDSRRYVATRAVEAMGEQLTPDARLLLYDLLKHEDNGIRLAAVTALANAPQSSDAPHLIAVAKSSTGDISTEIVFNAIDVLGKAQTSDGKEFVRTALVDPRPIVRLTAARVLRDDFGIELGVTEVPPRDFGTNVPLVGREYPQLQRNPLVEMETTRGKMVFELFPAEAPVHVVNFLALASAGHYDGLTFHRVVPDFVIQGGDYRGDGNGAKPFQGEALRSEFTPRKYVRGTLGMPRNADVDSGGSQFFVTHRPTPHLDGLYTIFGQLRGGGEVLDRIEQGDRIVGVRVAP